MAFNGIAQQASTSSLRLLFHGDTREHWQRMPSMVSAYQQLTGQAQMQGKDVVRLNYGNTNIGRDTNEWELNVLLNNLMGTDAMVLSNHDGDLGARNLARGLNQARFKVLGSNLSIPKHNALWNNVTSGQLQNQPLKVEIINHFEQVKRG